MLNERKEYSQYTFPVWGRFAEDAAVFRPDPSGLRLRYRTLTNDFSGIPRAMTIIARGFLFNECPAFPESESLPDPLYDAALQELMNWFGAGSAFHETAYGWFPAYVSCGLLWDRLYQEYGKTADPGHLTGVFNRLSSAAASAFADGYLSLDERPHVWNGIRIPPELSCLAEDPDPLMRDAAGIAIRLFRDDLLGSSYARKRKNYRASIMQETDWVTREGERAGDRNRGTYDRFIADALDLGPLREYVLVCRKDIWDHTWIAAGRKKVLLSGAETAGGRNAAAKDAILKIAASVLLDEMRYDLSPHPDLIRPDYGSFPVADLQNWIGGERATQTGRYFCGPDDTVPLFTRVLNGTAAAGIRIDENWLEKTELALASAGNIPERCNNNAYLYYADETDSVPLIPHSL